MFFLTEDARLVCKHELGKVKIKASQDLVAINHRCALVENDPAGRPIVGCPNYGATIKPCTRTLAVRIGYSDLIHIGGKRVCLDTVCGLTDGTLPGVVDYIVRSAGQGLVREIE